MATTKDKPGTDLERFSPIDEVSRWLTEPDYIIPWPEQNAEDAVASINAGVLAQEDPLATQEGDALKVEAAVGISFQLVEVQLRPSDPTSGADEGGAYAILRGPTADGELVTIITGAQKVMARAIALVRREQLGRWVMIQAGKDTTRQGRTFYDLVAGSEPFPS
jgi:hypothetical protein